MREVLLILRPGGKLVLMGGEYKGGKFDERNAKWVKLGNMTYHTTEEMRRLFLEVGFSEADVFEEYIFWSTVKAGRSYNSMNF